MPMSRRKALELSLVGSLGAALPGAPREAELPPPIAKLKPMIGGVSPVTLEEHKGRLARAKSLMAQEGLDAMVMAPGSSLAYFTGARWGLSERFFGMVLTREGDPAWVTPAFEGSRAAAQIRIGSDVRAWEEHESPYALVASILRDRNAAGGCVGVEEAMPFVFADGIGRANPAARLVSATGVTAGCRMIKDSHECALIRRACEVTLHAHRATFASLEEGMTQEQVSALWARAHERLGLVGETLVLFGADAAFPHGTTTPRPLRAGDFVLLDGGGSLHGYWSDITRTGVFGRDPTPRQRTVWTVVRKAQEAARRAARPGVECQAVDAAARAVIEAAGFGAGYRGLTHRLGHGIGMDGHEWTYLVPGNTTLLRPGMCFSNEPGIYLPGELGVRLEDIMVMTEAGAEGMTPWSGTPEDPAVV
jgi:Xaa-Pro dipeptidase